MTQGPRIISYAFGGGVGHVTRTLAILRQARRLLGAEVRALTNSPHAHLLEAAGIRTTRLVTAPGWHPDALADWVFSAAMAFRPDVFTVDAFPRGILGEMGRVLPHVPCPTLAILRRLKDEYVRRYGIGLFACERYDATAFVEDVGEPLTTAAGGRATETMPAIVRDAEELLSREEARVRLGAEPNLPFVLAVASGSEEQARAFVGAVRTAWRGLGQPGVIRFVGAAHAAEPESATFHFPLIELLPGVDLVIGAAGYNLFHEVHAVGVPAVFLPQNRLYDDQFGRASQARVAHDPGELESLMADALRNWQVARGEPSYANGAHEVVSLLGELAAQRTSRR
jgi:hypothetical protein